MVVLGSLLSLPNGGLRDAGGDIFHGFIDAKRSMFGLSGDITWGNSAWYVGRGSFDATYLHSLGHVMQFYGSMYIGGKAGLNYEQSAGLYLAWSGPGVYNGEFVSTPETWADAIGGIFDPGF